MSQIQTTCPHCQKKLKVNETLLGKTARCPACQERFAVTAVAFAGTGSQDPSLEAIQTRDDGGGDSTSADGASSRSKVRSEPSMGRIGRFELKQVLGQGGFGKVYRAYDPVLDRQVALKVPRFGSDDKKHMRRFLVEAKAAACMRHPNIVAVFESGQADGQAFIAAEFVEGEPLSSRIARDRPDFITAVTWVVELAEALGYAHGEGVVHRDIKPQNVMLGKNERPQLMDFGLAKRVDEDSSMTAEGSLLGTPAYMSPEQARGETDKVGPASDQYSLGVMLYELLTGKKPFDGPPHSVIAAAASQEPPAPCSLNASIPADLAAICQKAMAKEITSRYVTAGALADDLRRWLRHDETRARPIGRAERLRRWCRRNPVIAGLIAAVVGTLVLGAGVSTYFAVNASRRAKEALVAQGQADEKSKEARQSAAAAKKSADEAADRAATLERQLYIDRVNRAIGELQQNNFASAERLLEECPEKLRGWEWRYCKGMCHLELLAIAGPELPRALGYYYGRERSVAFSPDGRWLAAQGKDMHLHLWDPKTGESGSILKEYDGVVFSVAFSPDARLLAIGCVDESVRLWNLETGKVDHVLKMPSVSAQEGKSVATTVTFMRRGTVLATMSPNEVVLWDVPTGRLLNRAAFEVGGVSPIVCPGEREVAGSHAKGEIYFFDIESGKKLREFHLHKGIAFHVTFNPDGTLAASAGTDRILVWESATGKVLQTLLGHSSFVKVVAFSPDGKRLASCSEDRTSRIWELATGREELTFQGHKDFVNSVSFSPDGQLLASAGEDGLVKIWDATRDRTTAVLRNNADVVPDGGWDADGRRVYMTYGNAVQVWDSRSARMVGSFAISRKDFWAPTAWSPDRRELAFVRKKGIGICELESGKETQRALDTTDKVQGLNFTPDGRRLFVILPDELVVLDGKTRAPLFSRRLDRPFTRVASDSDGRRVALAGAKEGTVLDLETGQSLFSFPVDLLVGPSAAPFVFMPDGKHLLNAEGKDLVLYDCKSGNAVRRMSGHSLGILDLRVSPDGERIASAGLDFEIKLWDAATGDEVFTLRGLHGGAIFAAFSPDGNGVLAGGYGEAARIWDASPLVHRMTHGTPLPDNSGNLLKPTDSADSWRLDIHDVARVALEVGDDSIAFKVDAITGTNWHSQANQIGLDLKEGAVYTVKFKAKAAQNRRVILAATIGKPDWHGIGLNEDLSLTKEFQTFEYRFQAQRVAEKENRIGFILGGETGTVFVKEMSLTEDK